MLVTTPLSETDCARFLEDMLLVGLSWSWDSRFQTTLSSFKTEEQYTISELLEKHLGTPWDNASLESAPDSIHQTLVRFGGLMSGQLFYARGLRDDDGLVFCAWWPWGNGLTVSIRIGTNPENLPMLDLLVPADSR